MKPEIVNFEMLKSLAIGALEKLDDAVVLEDIVKGLFLEKVITLVPGTQSFEVVPKYTFIGKETLSRTDMIQEIVGVWSDANDLDGIMDYFENGQIDYLETQSDETIESIYVDDVLGGNTSEEGE